MKVTSRQRRGHEPDYGISKYLCRTRRWILTTVVSPIWRNVTESNALKRANEGGPFVKRLFLDVPYWYEQYSNMAKRRERCKFHGTVSPLSAYRLLLRQSKAVQSLYGKYLSLDLCNVLACHLVITSISLTNVDKGI